MRREEKTSKLEKVEKQDKEFQEFTSKELEEINRLFYFRDGVAFSRAGRYDPPLWKKFQDWLYRIYS